MKMILVLYLTFVSHEAVTDRSCLGSVGLLHPDTFRLIWNLMTESGQAIQYNEIFLLRAHSNIADGDTR